jgi:phosphatidylinositol alpha-1,6-mannosyltransferase
MNVQPLTVSSAGASARSLPSVLFCATGVFDSVGGIAAANQNVHTALNTVCAELGLALHTLVLAERQSRGSNYRAFGGNKVTYTTALLARLPRSRAAVFDHVRLSLPILATSRSLRPPIIICAHGSESWRRIRPLSKRAFAAADLVVANSAYTLAKMQSHVSSVRAAACPLGLPQQFPLTERPAPPSEADIALTAADGLVRPLGSRVMLLVSRMDAGEREKGHRELIEVLPAVAAAVPGAQLVLVGDGSDYAHLLATARASGHAGGIFLPGKLARRELEEIYRKAYLYVMPSRQEGFGLAYLEAMNYARPCVACRDDGGAEVVGDGDTGLLVGQPIDRDELSAALVRLLSDEALARRMGEAGWRRLHEHYSAQAHQQRFMKLIRPLVA